MATGSLCRTAASMPCSEIRPGTCCAPADLKRRSCEPQASIDTRAQDISIGTRCSSNARSRLTRRGGRIGLVLPSGFATDHTSAPLRRALFAKTSVDAISGFDNRHAIFPIHRSVRFLICTSTVGDATRQIACRFGIADPAELETIPDAGDRPRVKSHPIVITTSFLEALSGHTLTIPELRTEIDVRIIERVVHGIPRLDASDGWNARFGRELNATDDRGHFYEGQSGLPVIEGKHIEPFRALVDRAAQQNFGAQRGAPPGRCCDVLAIPHRLPRCRQRFESPHAHRRGPSTGSGHDAFPFLLEDAAFNRRSGVSVCHAQQLRRELPRTAGDDNASRIHNGRSPSGTEASVSLAVVRADRRVVARTEAGHTARTHTRAFRRSQPGVTD